MLEHDLLIFTRKLTELGAPYMITGSWATTLYGQPRMTHDVDIVVHFEAKQIARLPDLFPPDEFYCPSLDEILRQVQRPRRGQFNVIHSKSGSKADFYVSRDDPVDAWGFSHARTFQLSGGDSVVVAPPGYVIVRKLEFYARGGSEKHLHDIRGVLAGLGEEIDLTALEQRLRIMGLMQAWEKVKEGS